MSVRTKAAGTLAALLLAGGAYAVVERQQREQRTTAEMPRPKYKPPAKDGRAYAVIQACYTPSNRTGTLAYILGPINKTEVMQDVVCPEPWERRGLVRTGDTLSLSWDVGTGPDFRGFKYRFTVNGLRVVDQRTLNQRGTASYVVTGAEGVR